MKTEYQTVIFISKQVKILQDKMTLLARDTVNFNFDPAFIKALEHLDKTDKELMNMIKRFIKH